jgi:poly(ADP-ribose) glycohydrolase ARH3
MAAVTGVRILRSKFRGCLLGALFGDALGAEFEGEYFNVPVPSHEFDQFSKEELSLKLKEKKCFRFTDDSAMTMALCCSLLAEKSFNISHLARQFVETYFRESWRGYGGAVVTVFDRLRTETLEDVTLPAREQFDGSGSYGNGAAMRVSPLALFYHNDLDELKKVSLYQ